MSATRWKDALAGRIAEDWAGEIDHFESQLELRRAGKLDEKAFAETRLRRGVYGQRYDNGQRHDGIAVRSLDFPERPTKGPETLWDAPGMQRIKIPFGGLSPGQLEALADLAEEYSDEILHVTTRQDFQLHFVHIEDTPDLMRRLAAVGITTREACGNSVRNVTACPLAGVCRSEAFDVSPYAAALMRFLLGHPDVQDFGRKFKPAFSGCEDSACGLVQMHDAGFVARLRDGARGFKVVVGGGLGAVPHQAQVLSEFTPERELLPQVQAVARVFARLGEKKNRGRARIKFLVARLGIEEFRRLVEEERAALPPDPRHTAFLAELGRAAPGDGADDAAGGGADGAAGSAGNGAADAPGFARWRESNVAPQRQPGRCVVAVHLPLGDLTAQQARALADIARRYAKAAPGDGLRSSVEQNVLLRFVAEADLPGLHAALCAAGLGEPGAAGLADVTACPGTDTCKLGIAASRGLAAELRGRLAERLAQSAGGAGANGANGANGADAEAERALSELRIKISGCFNSCGQHHIADIGFYGNSRKIEGRVAPHFQVILGGESRGNAAAYGMAMGSVPSKAAPQVVAALCDAWLQGRAPQERFPEWAQRQGKRALRAIIQPFMKAPPYAEAPHFYSDWSDAREFSIGDLGVGECAGEVVSLFGIEVMRAESQAFDAQLSLDDGDAAAAEAQSYRAMLSAARALVRMEFIDIGEEPDEIVREFKARYFDTERFFDRFAGGKFGQYLLDLHADATPSGDRQVAARRIEEAQLFIEAAHACEARSSAERQAQSGAAP